MINDILPLKAAFEKYRTHYDNGGADYSVSELIQPPRITLLQKRHFKEILAKPLKIADYIDSFDGTATHMLLEKMLYGDCNWLLERRLFMDVLDRKISGCPDCIHINTQTLYDYKKTSVWKKIFGDTKKWEQQLNLYKLMIDQELSMPLKIKRIKVIGWWKDWKERDLKEKGNDYPKERIEEINIKLWTPDAAESVLYDSVGVLIENEDVPDEYLPLCTNEDKWVRDEKYAVIAVQGKKKAKKAARLLNTSEEAVEYATKNPAPGGWKWQIDFRPGTQTRCENYCDAADWCSQWQQYKQQMNGRKKQP